MEFKRAEPFLQKLGLIPGPGPARLKPLLPAVAVALGPDRVGAVRLLPAGKGKGSDARPTLAAFHEAGMPAEALCPSLTQPNLADPAPVSRAVGEVLAAVAPKETRVSAVLPDGAARVAILAFPRMPPTRREALDLIRFRMQKVLPFKIEEAMIDFHLLAEKEEPEFLVALIQRPILWQYERLFSDHDRIPGLVDIESLNIANLLLRAVNGAGFPGDQALVNASEGCLTVLFFRGGVLNFFRSKQIPSEERGRMDRLGPAIRRELATCAAFYREHLAGGGFAQAAIRAVAAEPGLLLEIAAEELGCPARLLDPGRAVRLPAGAAWDDPRWQRLAPALGAALGRRP